jgi:predicted transcriptional regulator
MTMAMTNAQRQRAYRIRRKTQGHFKAEGAPMERIDAWISQEAAHGLRVLAALHGVSAQEELNGLLLTAIAVAKQQDRPAWSDATFRVLG